MMNNVFIILRFLLCLPGAAALLYMFSYPDAVIPPNPALEEMEGIHWYALKPFMWVLPVLYLELVSGCGSRRNLVWFSSLGLVLIAALAAYPVLASTRPELVEPTFTYQGGMLYEGLADYSVFLLVSLAFRKVLLTYMFPPEDLQEQLEVGFVSATVLNPATARTVKEIAAEEKAAAPRFRFKAGDARAALRFRLIMQRLMLRSRIANAAVAAGVVLLALWFFLYPQPTTEEALQRDKAIMLQHRVTPQGQILATNAAVHAAARVMKYISDHESLAGMQREEAEKWLGIDQITGTYRRWLRDERPIKLASVNSMHENRTRFLTVTNGRQICVLYIRTNDEDNSIIISEIQEAGWDAVADENRRRMGTDWGALFN
ncbi:MAG: hypothetical protein IKA55_08145 [Akkermansia sp.]|nr:hypothetical protein [Akkermansia sp.]